MSHLMAMDCKGVQGRVQAPAYSTFVSVEASRRCTAVKPSRNFARSIHCRHQRMRSCHRVYGSLSGQTGLREIIEKLLDKGDLSEDESRTALYELIKSENDNVAQMAAFMVLLRAKGETAEEIAGLAKAMQELCVPVETPHKVLDIVGTGGDGIGSVNISTGATVVAAAAGAKVAKHGNRSVSSLCGSGDVVEAMGVALELGPQGISKCIDEAGLGFMFAPTFHPAMKAVVPVRKALGVRTAFNMLGPLLNPAHAKYALLGVYSTSISHLMADAAQLMGIEKALVVHSMGLDELTPMGPASVVEICRKKGKSEYEIDPLDFGIRRCEVKDLQGGDAKLNAQILKDVFGGSQGAVADALNLNAGVALAAAEVAPNVAEGIAMAQEAQKSGKTAETLIKWIQVSNEAKSANL
eukprot:jgi/Picsp_1/2617/NSC_00847-R1_anthranilate phosphoribosyltransferase